MYYVADKIGTVESFIGGLKSQFFISFISPHHKASLTFIQTNHCVQKTDKTHFFTLNISFVRCFFNYMENFVS